MSKQPHHLRKRQILEIDISFFPYHSRLLYHLSRSWRFILIDLKNISFVFRYHKNQRQLFFLIS